MFLQLLRKYYRYYMYCTVNLSIKLGDNQYCQTRLIRTLLIRHFCLICWGNLKTLKALSLTPMLNYSPISSPRLVHHKISAYFSNELSGSNSIYLNHEI